MTDFKTVPRLCSLSTFKADTIDAGAHCLVANRVLRLKSLLQRTRPAWCFYLKHERFTWNLDRTEFNPAAAGSETNPCRVFCESHCLCCYFRLL